jgi:hypothetical protein
MIELVAKFTLGLVFVEDGQFLCLQEGKVDLGLCILGQKLGNKISRGIPGIYQ